MPYNNQTGITINKQLREELYKIKNSLNRMNTRKANRMQTRRRKASGTRKQCGGKKKVCGARCPRAPRGDRRRLHLIGPNYPPCCVQCGCCL